MSDRDELETCALCRERSEHNGDWWEGLCPSCADRVSELMDAYGCTRDEALVILARKKGE